MIRLSEILNKEEAERKWENVVKKECSYFIENSIDLLRDSFFLYRKSTSGRGTIEHVEPRKRRRIQGNPWRTFFYRQFKPSGVHNRRKMFACQGGNSPKFMHGDLYKIFPVGTNYQLYYNPDVEDFNRNDLIEKHFKSTDGSGQVSNRFSSLLLDRVVVNELDLEGSLSGVETVKDINVGDNFSEMIERIGKEKGNRLFGLLQTVFFNRGYKYDFGSNKQLYWFLLDHKKELKNILEETYELLETYRNYYEDYFSGLKSVDNVEKGMKDREVNVYAPQGVYYVRDDFEIPEF